jgi:hypothetical protein
MRLVMRRICYAQCARACCISVPVFSILHLVDVMTTRATKAYCIFGLVLFIALSAIDFTQTWELIEVRQGKIKGGRVVEGNPVADVWLKQYDWRGLVVYKSATVVLVVTCIILMTRYRPLTGALVVTLACLILITVTNYSRNLLAEQTTVRDGTTRWRP